MREGITARGLRWSARSRKRRRVGAAIIRAAAPFVPDRPGPPAPVFVIGSPRSGTTVLFRALDRSPHLASLDAESHLLWEAFHPAGRGSWSSHALGAADLSDRERRALRFAVDRLSAGRRYLDKDPRNCLRLGYLDALFPDARFVFLRRDGRAVVSSLISGWRSSSRHFPGTPLPLPLRVSGYEGATWRFVVPPGWERYTQGHDLAEVCAFQWTATTEAVLDARERMDASRWITVSYEELVEAPVTELRRLLEELRLEPDDEVTRFGRDLGEHVAKAVTPPRANKWRDENPEEIRRVLPLIAPTMRRLGYDPET